MLLLLWCVLPTLKAATLIIGTSGENPPLSFQVDSKNYFSGFEVELMDQICQRINMECKYKAVLVSNILDDLNTGTIDFAIAAIISPPTPLPGYLFGFPYLQSSGRFMVLKDSPINSLNQLVNTTIGVRKGTLERGSLFKELVLKRFNNQVNVVEYADINSLIAALSAQEVDAIFSNDLPIEYWYYTNPTLYKLVGNALPVGNNYSIMTAINHASLLEQMNKALLTMMDDGTYLRIYKRYFDLIYAYPNP